MSTHDRGDPLRNLNELERQIVDLEGRGNLGRELISTIKTDIEEARRTHSNLKKLMPHLDAIKEEITGPVTEELKPVTKDLKAARGFSRIQMSIGIVGLVVSIIVAFSSSDFVLPLGLRLSGQEGGEGDFLVIGRRDGETAVTNELSVFAEEEFEDFFRVLEIRGNQGLLLADFENLNLDDGGSSYSSHLSGCVTSLRFLRSEALKAADRFALLLQLKSVKDMQCRLVES